MERLILSPLTYVRIFSELEEILVIFFITKVAVKSPVTLIAVLHISSILSTPKISAMPSRGTPIPCRIVAKITIPTPGVLGVPIDAPTVVSAKITNSINVKSIPKSCVKNMAAHTW